MFGNTNLGYRKSEFSGSVAEKGTAVTEKNSLATDRIQESSSVFTSPKKPANGGNFNFEFKKKKGNESAVEQAVSFGGSTGSSPGKQPLTRRRNLMPQREIKLSDF